jgi:chorismate mutase-like protein
VRGWSGDQVALDALVVLIARRLVLGADVAAAKFAGGGQIDDPARETEILDWVATRLPSGGVGPDTGVAFFRDQIVANKIIQHGPHRHWRESPADLPVGGRRLTDEIRPQFDVINRHMLLLLPSAPCLSHGQLTTVGELLGLKLSAHLPLRQLGGIRRAAVRIAVRSLRDAASTA